jgi:hypothetical protein
LEFYIDEVFQDGSISGEVDWQKQNNSIPAGSHTVKWRYMKYGSESSGQDAGWVDEVSFISTPPPPTITVNDSNFGFGTNGFGFNVSGTVGQTVVVEGSSNLVNWLSLQTNTLDGNPLYFSDTNSAGMPDRFYRARLLP